MAALHILLIPVSALWSLYFAFKALTTVDDVRKKLRKLALCFAGLAVLFGVGGYLSVQRISQSARLTTEGTIQTLAQWGRKNPYTEMELLAHDGRTITLRCKYHGYQLTPRQAVEVTYLANSGSILQLKVTAGPYAGWTRSESDGLWSSYAATVAGVAFAILAIAMLLKRPKPTA